MRVVLPVLALLLLTSCASVHHDDSTTRCVREGCREIVIDEVRDIAWEGSRPGRDADGQPVHLRTGLTLSGAEIQRVRVEFDDFHGTPSIRIELTEAAGLRMAAFSSELIGKHIALIVDDTVISTPYIQSTVGRHMSTNGFESMEDARRIQRYLLGY